jgi:hypothetical protein
MICFSISNPMSSIMDGDVLWSCLRKTMAWKILVCSTHGSTGHVIQGRVCAFVGREGFAVAWLFALLLRR